MFRRLAVILSTFAVALLPVSAWASPVPVPQVAPAAPAAPLPVVKPPMTAQIPQVHSADCTHGCWASTRVCVIIATTWGPTQTMWARWWYASYSLAAEFRSPEAGCNDYPGSRRFTISAFNDPNYNNCWKWQGTTRAADGHWNNHIVVYFNWGIPSCRTSQVEIEHRLGAAIGWAGGAPLWNETDSPWAQQILNMTEYSIHNINEVYNLSGQQWVEIYGSQV